MPSTTQTTFCLSFYIYYIITSDINPRAHSLPHDPDSVTFIIGATVALNFAILSWAQALMWPASKAPYCKLCFGLLLPFGS